MIPRAAALFEKLPRSLRRHRLMTAWLQLTGEDPIQLVRIRDESLGYADMRDGFLRLIVIDGDFEHESTTPEGRTFFRCWRQPRITELRPGSQILRTRSLSLVRTKPELCFGRPAQR